MSITQAIENLKQHVKNNPVTPGQPYTFNAATVGDGVWQGDLGLEIVDKVPANYILVENPTDKDRQLVPESGAGSHHRLRSLDGVRLYLPPNWGVNATDLAGPCVVFSKANAIDHEPGHEYPHGAVFIEAVPTIILCRYQQNWSIAQRIALRAKD